MKNDMRKSFIGFFILILASAPSASVAGETLVISAIEGNANLTRISKAVLREVYARAGLKVQFMDLPGKRSVVSANDGITDGENIRSKRASSLYPNLRRIDIPVVTDEIVAFSKRIAGPIKSIVDMDGLRVGFRRGSIIQTKMMGTRSWAEFDSIDSGVQMLEHGRLDIMLYFRYSAVKFMRDNYPRTLIRPISEKLRIVKLYHYLHKRNQHLVPRLKQILQRMAESGRQQEIVNAVLAEK